jgi:hypothetical protein
MALKPLLSNHFLVWLLLEYYYNEEMMNCRLIQISLFACLILMMTACASQKAIQTSEEVPPSFADVPSPAERARLKAKAKALQDDLRREDVQ